jgi:hypothetical protein
VNFPSPIKKIERKMVIVGIDTGAFQSAIVVFNDGPARILSADILPDKTRRKENSTGGRNG